MGSCKDLKGSAVKSVVLGIRLAGATVYNREHIARKVLEDKKVRAAIHEAFRAQAGNMIKAQLAGESMTGAAATAFVSKIAEAANPKVIAQVKKQPSYKEAQAGLKKLKCSFDKTPVGVFVNEHKTLVIIAGALVGVGSAVALYKTKTGDVPASAIAKVTELAAKNIEVGNVTFSASGLHFKPSTREVKGTLGITIGKLKGIHGKFEMTAGFKGKKATEFKVAESLVVPLTDRTKLTGKASIGIAENTPAMDMSLTLKHTRGRFSVSVTASGALEGITQTGTVKASADYKLKPNPVFGRHATVGASTVLKATRPDGSSPFQTSANVNVGLVANF